MDSDEYLEVQWRLLLRRYSLLTRELEEELFPNTMGVNLEGNSINTRLMRRIFKIFVEQNGGNPNHKSSNILEVALYMWAKEKHLFRGERWWSRKKFLNRK